MNTIKVFGSGLFIVMSLVCYSQTGPNMPCPDCQQNYIRAIPYEGSWFNPQQPGSGFLFEVQNDTLLGYYFGYDENGETEWALFSGQLQDGGETGALWKVSATLEKFTGGACLSCEYVAPEQNVSLGEIELVFNRVAHASFSVNGGEAQNIVPLYFRYAQIDFSEQQPAYQIPEIEGWWTIFIDKNQDLPDQYTYINYLVNVSKSSINSSGELVFSSSFWPNPPELIASGNINSSKNLVGSDYQTSCTYIIPLFAETLVFNINYANIAPDRIYGETLNGDTLEMIRTGSDYCIKTNQPEKCINTGIFDYLD